ncbi:MAG: hypothetical protein Q4D60_07190 [Eubacteriales bacterium]|nr:hypothetical protein [Eubacteriales bacterium]
MEKKERKKLSFQDFGMEKIILLAVAGLILLVTNLPGRGDAKRQEGTDEAEIPAAASENDAYIEGLENKLVHILEHVDGVGEVEVMITVKASREAVLNKDDSVQSEAEQETSDGTSKERKSTRREQETVLADAGGEAAPYVIKELEPEIAGIVIACQGAEDNRIKAAVTEAAQVLFGVSASHIKVLKMEVRG